MAWTLCSGTRKKERVRILGNVKLSARLSAVPDNAQSSLSIKMSGFWKFNNAAISIGYSIQIISKQLKLWPSKANVKVYRIKKINNYLHMDVYICQLIGIFAPLLFWLFVCFVFTFRNFWPYLTFLNRSIL